MQPLAAVQAQPNLRSQWYTSLMREVLSLAKCQCVLANYARWWQKCKMLFRAGKRSGPATPLPHMRLRARLAARSPAPFSSAVQQRVHKLAVRQPRGPRKARTRAQEYYSAIATAVMSENLLTEMALTHAGAVASTLQMPLALTGSAAGVAAGAGMPGMLLGHAGGPAGGALAGSPLAGALLPYMQNHGLQHAGSLGRPMYPGAHLGPQFAPQARPRLRPLEQA